jgi:hypothetical protein
MFGKRRKIKMSGSFWPMARGIEFGSLVNEAGGPDRFSIMPMQSGDPLEGSACRTSQGNGECPNVPTHVFRSLGERYGLCDEHVRLSVAGIKRLARAGMGVRLDR